MPLFFVRNQEAGVLELVPAQLAEVAPQVFRVFCSRVVVQDVLCGEAFSANVAIKFAFKAGCVQVEEVNLIGVPIFLVFCKLKRILELFSAQFAKAISW